jgi:hypothetical protein
VGSIGLEVGVDVLKAIVVEGAATEPVIVVLVNVHDGDLVLALLEVDLTEVEEVLLAVEGDFDRVDNDLLDDFPLEINFECIKVEVFEVEGELSQSVVLGGHEDDIEVVPDAAFPNEGEPLIGRLLVQTHHEKTI